MLVIGKIDNPPNRATGNTAKTTNIIAIQLRSLAKHCPAKLVMSYNLYKVK